MKLVNFGLVALLSSYMYGMIYSPQRLLPAIQSSERNKSLTAGCLSTGQFNLYNKSDGNPSEIWRTRLPKLHTALPQHRTDHVQLKARPNFAPTPADYIAYLLLFCKLCVHKQLPGCTMLNLPATSNLFIVVLQHSLKTVDQKCC